MNKSVRLLSLLVALAGAAVISFVVYQRMAGKPAVLAIKEKQETVKIAVVEHDLKRGAKITTQDLRMANYLAESLPTGHFTDLTDAVGRIVVKPIHTTEPVLESALAPTSLTKGGMAAVITPLKRAMAVKVDEVVGVAGFLHPGHMVDVLVSIDKPGQRRDQITKTVLENIPVLSIGTQAQEQEDKSSKRVTVVTLEVTLEEGEKLALAVNEGRIQLALRGYTDEENILTKGITVESLLKSYATASSAPVKVSNAPVKVAAAPRQARRSGQPFVVEVMNGNSVSRIQMKR
ncbi:Flp pilus assembly protein CpaB [Desulfosediminicola ganghwensis]|uniref:Flp pilus assembly protein CpaB n=1 Tax=Desulfosediminicola ganghwensis TaxID=2569540 RepID=UPI0010AB8010|nr:Flp pilus assembly protein CpaB [Desulfosediminicola ganghwensis]